jgi:hypothetical protein
MPIATLSFKTNDKEQIQHWLAVHGTLQQVVLWLCRGMAASLVMIRQEDIEQTLSIHKMGHS